MRKSLFVLASLGLTAFVFLAILFQLKVKQVRWKNPVAEPFNRIHTGSPVFVNHDNKILEAGLGLAFFREAGSTWTGPSPSRSTRQAGPSSTRTGRSWPMWTRTSA
jgi:hypothetical protein